jgi:hypothetical protein
MMMNKEFCTYEQALALKELGFDEPCFGYYQKSSVIGDNTILPIIFRDKASNFNDYEYSKLGVPFCSAPLYQQAFRWFREKYNLVFNFISYSIVKPEEYHWSITWNDEAKASGIVKTYEEAEQACLDKLIQIVKSKKDEQFR